jgi:hypothetical protein
MNIMKRLALSGALALAVAAPLLAPTQAKAWWGPRWGGWGWGWGWRPAFVVAPPVYLGAPGPYYAAAYPPPYARWVPGYFDARGYWVGSHWEPVQPPPPANQKSNHS